MTNISLIYILHDLIFINPILLSTQGKTKIIPCFNPNTLLPGTAHELRKDTVTHHTDKKASSLTSGGSNPYSASQLNITETGMGRKMESEEQH